MVNKVTLIGNLGRDPELRRLESGTAVAQFSVATNESYKDRDGNWRDQTEWHEIVVWRHLAERAETQLRKGMLIYLEGKLSTRSWQDKDGNPRKTTEVVGSYLRILNKRDEASSGGSSRPSSSGGAAASSSPSSTSAAPSDHGNSTSPSGDADANMDSDNSTDDSDLPF